VFEEHMRLNDEQAKYIRTQSTMHECHFDLNTKYGNTHFILNEKTTTSIEVRS
jgi:hypothetical protein